MRRLTTTDRRSDPGIELPAIKSAGADDRMKKRVRLTAVGLAIFFLAAAFGTVTAAQDTEDRTGFQFLDRLVVLMVRAAAPGGGGGDIGPDVVLLAKDLKAAHEAKQVDDLFAVRYSRMLSAVRQAILMDPEVLYWPMYRYSMVDFIEERTGRIPDWKELLFIVNDHGGAGVGLGMVADAIMSEVVSLHVHLENLDRRPDILKGYLERGMKAAGAGRGK
jgi:hypothetical protein